MPRILVVGKGVIGTFLGKSLQSAGCEVQHLLRPNHRPSPVSCLFKDLRARKYRFKDKHYQHSPLSDFNKIREFDFLFLPVGNYALREAVKMLMPHLNPSQYLILCGNIWQDIDYLNRYYHGRYVFAFPHFGGLIKNGNLKGWLTPDLSLGEADGSASDRLKSLKELLESSGYKPTINSDMRSWLLTHFAWNTGIMTEAFVQNGFGKMAQRFWSLKRAFHITREAMQVVQSLGVDFLKMSEGQKAMQPIWWNALKTMLFLRLSGFAKNADPTKNEREWKSYGQSVLKSARKKNIYLPHLEYYSELLST